MKLHLMSDLHLDLLTESDRNRFFLRLKTQDLSQAQALVLAGDIASLRDDTSYIFRQALQTFCELYPRIYVISGNHENWGTSISGADTVLQEISKDLHQVTVLKSGVCHNIGDGLTIGGGTLWYPDCGDGILKACWPDYRFISDNDKIHSRHRKFLKWKKLPDIVVTHHMPTEEFVARQWKGDVYNVFFCAGLEKWLASKKQSEISKLWLFGHTHNPMDLQSKFGFRGYSNPLGY